MRQYFKTLINKGFPDAYGHFLLFFEVLVKGKRINRV
jgi:hypothetical protein